MSNEIIADDKIVALVKQAKHRPLPTSSKALFFIVLISVIFTGGIAFEKHRATSTTGSSLSLSALGGAGGFGGAAGFGGGGGRNRNGAAGGGFGGGTAATGGSLSLSAGGPGTAAGAAPTATVAADVAGTVVSVSKTSVVIATLSGGNETFPITATTKVRASSTIDLSTVKAGDIVTIKPDESANAKTIMVVK